MCFAFWTTTVSGQFADEPDPTLDSLADDSKLTAKSAYVIVPATEAQLKERLAQLTGCLELKVTSAVRSYVRTYTSRPQRTSQILGRRLQYFHIFEQKLREYGLPTDLKYLAVVESALNPNAVSRVGATGLWQFMPGTGLEYGMEINSAIDERSNVVKSSDAAARYLKHLYDQYNDWALVLAAYNSGPMRVDNAMRRARSRDFWAIQRFLPNETRNYVPAFIAASYICNFYQEHRIPSENIELDAQLTDYMLVHDGLSFSAIADATGLKYADVKALNPGFKRNYIPPSQKGYYVLLPKRVMPAFIRHLNGLGGHQYRLDGNAYAPTSGNDIGNGYYYTTLHTATEVDFAERFAQKLGCSGEQLMAWNKMENMFVYPNQTYKVYHPVLVQKHSSERIVAPSPKVKKVDIAIETPVRDTPVKPAAADNAAGIAAPKKVSAAKSYEWHVVRRNESLDDIARRYSTSVDNLRKLNGKDPISAGMKIKVKEM